MLPISDIDTKYVTNGLRSLEASSSILAITLPRILAILAKLPEILQHNMSDASGSADAPLGNLATPTASVAPTAGTSDSDAQTPVIFTVQMHKELTAKFKSLEEERNAINRKLTEMHTSVAADSLVLHGLPDLIGKKVTSHHQSLTRLMVENIDDFLGEVTDYVDGKVPANAASALAPAAAVPGFPLGFGPSIQSGLNRSFARAARSPPADAIRSPSPISRTPAVPAGAIHSDGSRKRAVAAFALQHGQSAMTVLENSGVDALLENSHLLSKADADNEELSSRIQEISASVENISMPGPSATSNLDSNRTFREHKKGKFVHPTQPAAAEHFKPGTRPAAANKWTKGTAPSTQHGPLGYKPSGFRPTTLADQNPALLAYVTSHGNSPAPIPPALAKPAKSRRPGTCWVKGCFGTGHTKWQDCPKTASYFTNHNGPGPMDTTVSKHSSSAHASHKRSASAAPPPSAQRR